MDLLKIIQKLPFAPPLFRDDFIDKFGIKIAPPYTTFPKRTRPISPST